MGNKVIWQPQPRQAALMGRWEDEALYGGAAGGGKSAVGELFEAILVQPGPGGFGVIFTAEEFGAQQKCADRIEKEVPLKGGLESFELLHNPVAVEFQCLFGSLLFVSNLHDDFLFCQSHLMRGRYLA